MPELITSIPESTYLQIRNPKSEIRNSKDHVVFVVGVTSSFSVATNCFSTTYRHLSQVEGGGGVTFSTPRLIHLPVKGATPREISDRGNRLGCPVLTDPMPLLDSAIPVVFCQER